MNFVPGNGPVPNKIMIIGEAPGKNEDEQGIPFIGRAGNILDSALESAGIPRETVYVTNVYKHRPPNNRKPTWDEINSHLFFLIQEFKEVDPSYILLLGATALETLSGHTKIGQRHGTRIFDPDITHLLDLPLDIGFAAVNAFWYCTYHPAATIYNKSVKEDFIKDVKTFGKIALGTYTL